MSNMSNVSVVSKASNMSNASNASIAKKNESIYSTDMITFVPTSEIIVGKYQKRLNVARSEKIAREFDVNRMRPVEVSLRGGKFYVFDGQHRVNAYKIMGMRSVPCIVHTGLSYEQEAELFARQQENVGAVLAHHKWNALVEAKDEKTLNILSIVKRFGYTMMPGSVRKNNINCVATIQGIYNDLGEQALTNALHVLSSAWKDEPKAICQDVIAGMKIFIRAFQNDKRMNYSRLINRLSEVTPEQFLRQSRNFGGEMGRAKCCAKQMVLMYNRNLRMDNKLSERNL